MGVEEAELASWETLATGRLRGGGETDLVTDSGLLFTDSSLKLLVPEAVSSDVLAGLGGRCAWSDGAPLSTLARLRGGLCRSAWAGP